MELQGSEPSKLLKVHLISMLKLVHLRAEILDHVMYRMGVLATIRSRAKQGSKSFFQHFKRVSMLK